MISLKANLGLILKATPNWSQRGLFPYKNILLSQSSVH